VRSLTVIQRFDGSQLFFVLFNQICKLKKEFSTFRPWGIETPNRLHGFFGSGYGEINIGRRPFGYLGNNLTSSCRASSTLSVISIMEDKMLARVDDAASMNVRMMRCGLGQIFILDVSLVRTINELTVDE
jgi:hypothetical protein